MGRMDSLSISRILGWLVVDFGKSEYLESMIVEGSRCEILREFGPQISSHDSRRCKSFILKMPRTMEDQIVDFPPARYQKKRKWFGIISRTRNRLIEPIDFERLYSRCA